MAGDRIIDSGAQKWIKVFGDVQIIKGLERLKTKMQRKIVRDAIYRGLQPIAEKARSLAREDTGLLKKSIDTKVTKMVSGKVFINPKVFAMKSQGTGGKFKQVQIAGPARNLGINKILTYLKAASGGEAEFKRPSKYARLLEFGTKNMAAKPFMRPAMQQSRDSALRAIAAEIKFQLFRETLKQEGSI